MHCPSNTPHSTAANGNIPVNGPANSASTPNRDGIQSTGKETAFKCAVCQDSSLHVGTISESQVCFCESCRGFVIDSESFGGLVSQLRSEYKGNDDRPIPMDQKQLEKVRHCPACYDQMQTHPYYGPGNVILDSCQPCGLTWLDNDELTKIKRAPGRR